MFKRITLDNGVRIVCEKIPYVRSVTLGIWVGTGSRNENKEINGISHFIEHLLFKGTKSRSSKDIADSIDSIGGQINAFTGKECTCYYTKTLDTHLDIAMDVLSDMFFNSKFDKKDIEVERKVIIEEIGMYEDTPEELVHDILSEAVWKGNSLGYPILGTSQSLHDIDQKKIREYMKDYYTPSSTVISVAGNFDDQYLTDLIKSKFSHWGSESKICGEFEKVDFVRDIRIKEKDTEQAHLCIGFEGVEHGSDELYTLLAINNIFGGGMSSRLFQKIREELGLVYSIYSYPSSYKNAGMFTIYGGMNPEHIEKVTELSMGEIKNLIKNGISKTDLEKSKEQLKGSYILGLESTSSRMNSIGKSELLLGRIYSAEEVLNKIDNINSEDVESVINKIFNTDNISISAVGNIKKTIDFGSIIGKYKS